MRSSFYAGLATLRNQRFRTVPENEIEILRRRVQSFEARVVSLKSRIMQIDQGDTALKFCALVDEEKCLGCGVCLHTCPTGAVSLEEVARIDPEHCIGCGRCVEKCPQKAISLYPLESFRKGAGGVR
jgi:NAD-dependent dihydropyrimidine dehydrogenase PreA subunit